MRRQRLPASRAACGRTAPAARRCSRGTASGSALRDDDPVLERVARARGRLRAVGRARAKRAVGPRAPGRRRTAAASARAARVTPWHGAQEARVREDQLGRQPALAQRALRAVQIGAAAASSRRARCARPASASGCHSSARDQHRDRRQAPRPLHAARIAVDVVADAVLVQQVRAPCPSAGRSSRGPSAPTAARGTAASAGARRRRP